MPIDPETIAGLERVNVALIEVCKRERMSFVAVVEPLDIRTGAMVMTEQNNNHERTVREAIGFLGGALSRLKSTRYAVVTTPHNPEPESDVETTNPEPEDIQLEPLPDEVVEEIVKPWQNPNEE